MSNSGQVFINHAGAFTSAACQLEWEEGVKEEKVVFRYPKPGRGKRSGP